MIEAASGINLWREWANVEVATAQTRIHLAPHPSGLWRHRRLPRPTKWPDLSGYNDPEIVWKLVKEHHAGLIVRSQDPARIGVLLDNYGERFARDFLRLYAQHSTSQTIDLSSRSGCPTFRIGDGSAFDLK